MSRDIYTRVSASAVRAFIACPYRYALDYVQRLPESEREQIPALAVGNAIHRALAQFIRVGGWSKRSMDDLVALLMRYWDDRAFVTPEASYEQFLLARDMIEAFYATPYPPVVARELGVEMFVTWSTPRRGLLASGKFDRVCRLPDDRIEVIDYKSGRRPTEDARLNSDLQAIFYRTLAADLYRNAGAAGLDVTFLYLDGMAAHTAHLDGEAFLRAWHHVEVVGQAIGRAREDMAAGTPLTAAFPPAPGEGCRGCPMRRHCTANHIIQPTLVQVGEGAA